MKYTVDEKEKTIKIHTNTSTESLKDLLTSYKGYTVIFEDDVQYTADNTCCGGDCGCNDNNEK